MALIEALLTAVALLGTPEFASHPACNALAWQSYWEGFDVPIVVELAWSESRFLPKARNKMSGCSGILQASPKFWCPGGKREGCDLQAAGLRALRAYLAQQKVTPMLCGPGRKCREKVTQAICHFKSGNTCTPKGLRGAKLVVQKADKLRKALATEGGFES